MAKYAILSDIHGNLQALERVYDDLRKDKIGGVMLLGDLIDYGMQSNEVVEFIKDKLESQIICNIWGNHERAITLSDFTRFSSERGRASAKRTKAALSKEVRLYLASNLIHEGYLEYSLEGKKCLAVHGSAEDHYWKAIFPEDVRGSYSKYDMVFSGHSHYSHMFTRFYDTDNPVMRNKHAVLFINPGSVGQPRNHHPEAQYAVFDTDTMSVELRSVPYDVSRAMAYFDKGVDDFYRSRLKNGV